MFRKIFVIITIVFEGIILNGICQTQETVVQNEKKEGRYYFTIGWNQLDIEKLNSKLTSKGYAQLSDNFFSIGSGCHSIKERFIVGCEGNLLFGKKRYSNIGDHSYVSSLFAVYGFLNMGYSIISADGLNVYPLVGAGFGGMWLNIGQNDFNEILDDPKGNANPSYGSFLLNFALGADYYWKLKEDEKEESGLVLGVRLGYSLDPFGGGWGDVSGGPDIGFRGPYIKLVIGGGGKSYN